MPQPGPAVVPQGPAAVVPQVVPDTPPPDVHLDDTFTPAMVESNAAVKVLRTTLNGIKDGTRGKDLIVDQLIQAEGNR